MKSPTSTFRTESKAPFADKLARLKRNRFTLRGRAERIAKSLAALATSQPTDLSPSEWREIIESDVEEQF
jgi:hypothetical protein